jgi:hypothetical protein
MSTLDTVHLLNEMLTPLCFIVVGNAGCYCPTPAQIIECEPGRFCPIGSIKPLPCHFFAKCSAGTEKPMRVGVLGIVIAVGLFFAYVFYIKAKVRFRSARFG